MTEAEYNRLTAAAFQQLETRLANYEDELDVETPTDGILEVEFEDGSKLVVNRQAAAQEIWVAARSGGFHFRWQDGEWHDTRSGEELFAAIARLASSQAGMTIRLV